jgi:hypothetical protein
MSATASTMATIDAFMGDFMTALGSLSLLSIAGNSVNKRLLVSATLPVDVNAQREIAVRFVMADEDLNQASFSIGGPDLSLFPFTSGDGGDIYQWDPTGVNATLADFVADVLVIARHPISNGIMTMKRLELVGRSN